MARKLRIEFEGARYHIINRGNFRSDVFESDGAAQSFLKALEEAVDKFGWVLFAYVVMRNHYHLAIETPRGNLSAGMHWLQSTFSTRFTRFRGERGHLFQGRFTSTVLEDEHAVRRVVDYIHLNPVRAKVVPIAEIGEFRWSSLSQLLGKNGMKGLNSDLWMEALDLPRTAKGWAKYLRHLDEVAGTEEDGVIRNAWAVGSQAWKAGLAKTYGAKTGHAALTYSQRIELKELSWEARLVELLTQAGRTEEELERAAKFPDWKLRIAMKLRDELGAKSSWLAQRLMMGKASSLRVYLSKQKNRINK